MNRNGYVCFAVQLFKIIREANPTGNIIISPDSIYNSLTMLSVGARGNTAAQFAKDFLTNIQNLYGAELSAVDFQNAASEARKQINQWVEEQTGGKILDLLPEGTVSEMTRLILVNAIYFNGSWEEPFEVGLTKEMPFQLNKKEKKTVKMMYMSKKLPFRYIPERKLSVLELPYKGKGFSMIVLLPDDIGLEELEKGLTGEELQEWTDPRKMSVSNVHVHIPTFELDQTFDLKSYLSVLGLWDVFDSSKADLSGMSVYPELHLSKIVHTSFIEVNEGGTKAAAATARIPMFSNLCRGKVFNINHPFMIILRDIDSGNIRILGSVASP
ncbi:leukocyte elastase inhibitor-like isoform X2 [Paroedura picta]|uniref:leukocyte elastase inhibitor-like isoform X2 n=1 Tax=Paroedura picta TaxID=143630 RepID=UPI0040577467